MHSEVGRNADIVSKDVSANQATLPVCVLLAIRHFRIGIVEESDRDRIGVERIRRRVGQRIRECCGALPRCTAASELVPPLIVIAGLDEQPGAEALVECELERVVHVIPVRHIHDCVLSDRPGREIQETEIDRAGLSVHEVSDDHRNDCRNR